MNLSKRDIIFFAEGVILTAAYVMLEKKEYHKVKNAEYKETPDGRFAIILDHGQTGMFYKRYESLILPLPKAVDLANAIADYIHIKDVRDQANSLLNPDSRE